MTIALPSGFLLNQTEPAGTLLFCAKVFARLYPMASCTSSNMWCQLTKEPAAGPAAAPGASATGWARREPLRPAALPSDQLTAIAENLQPCHAGCVAAKVLQCYQCLVPLQGAVNVTYSQPKLRLLPRSVSSTWRWVQVSSLTGPAFKGIQKAESQTTLSDGLCLVCMHMMPGRPATG